MKNQILRLKCLKHIWGGESKYYLFVGRIEEIKGVRLLIEAVKRMPKRD